MPQHGGYVFGEWNAACDVCGRVFKSDKLSEVWDGSMRCSLCWETRHPQDFVRGVLDDPSTPWARPWVPNFVASFSPDIWINNSGDSVQWLFNSGIPALWSFS